VVDSFRSSLIMISEFDAILESCRVLHLYFKNCHVEFSIGVANVAASTLARVR
jgi:hypothetical protein